ncbi:CREB-regulated transcription coactivator 3-like, partial [Ctenocephalides felis]|uniref:CREB-regulated transcription coactivator 3-like n=1 Tax=Ctenocephalides felis TaxID=7515 RepID=UPI000E6E32B4
EHSCTITSKSTANRKQSICGDTLRITQTLGCFRGGSLPNVSGAQTPEESAYSQPDDITLAQFGLASIQTHECLTSPCSPTSTKHPLHQAQQYHQQRESRSRGNIGPMRARPAERKVDTSPYGGSYLSPPPGDGAWRRASSDSALHQSVVQAGSQESLGLHHSLLTNSTQPRRDTYFEHSVQPPMDGRPRSSCEVPRVPGISIYPTHDSGTLQIPIGNNTGSLPDLTSVHFPSPLHTSHDQEEVQHSGSPYNSNHLSVPVNHRYSQRTKASHENSFQSCSSPNDINSGRRHNLFCGQTSPRNTSHVLYGSHGNLNMSQQSPKMSAVGVGGYRSPGLRPSPGSSPGATGGDSGGGGISTDHSAPCSPREAVHSAPYVRGTSYHGGEDGFLLTQMALQQHFEQCSMDWAQLVQCLLESGCTWTSQVQVHQKPEALVYFVLYI